MRCQARYRTNYSTAKRAGSGRPGHRRAAAPWALMISLVRACSWASWDRRSAICCWMSAGVAVGAIPASTRRMGDPAGALTMPSCHQRGRCRWGGGGGQKWWECLVRGGGAAGVCVCVNTAPNYPSPSQHTRTPGDSLHSPMHRSHGCTTHHFHTQWEVSPRVCRQLLRSIHEGIPLSVEVHAKVVRSEPPLLLLRDREGCQPAQWSRPHKKNTTQTHKRARMVLRPHLTNTAPRAGTHTAHPPFTATHVYSPPSPFPSLIQRYAPGLGAGC
jgi:hypothetical protein